MTSTVARIGTTRPLRGASLIVRFLEAHIEEFTAKETNAATCNEIVGLVSNLRIAQNRVHDEMERRAARLFAQEIPAARACYQHLEARYASGHKAFTHIEQHLDAIRDLADDAEAFGHCSDLLYEVSRLLARAASMLRDRASRLRRSVVPEIEGAYATCGLQAVRNGP